MRAVRTCDGDGYIDEVCFTGHQVCSLCENEHGLGMGQAAFMEEVLLEEFDVGTMAACVLIKNVKVLV